MDDLERAYRHCVQAQESEREISDACARVIASMYHAGQLSLSYAFTSTGFVSDGASPDTYGDSTYLYRQMFPDYEALSYRERLLANMMGTYLIDRVRRGEFGPVEGWSTLWL